MDLFLFYVNTTQANELVHLNTIRSHLDILLKGRYQIDIRMDAPDTIRPDWLPALVRKKTGVVLYKSFHDRRLMRGLIEIET